MIEVPRSIGLVRALSLPLIVLAASVALVRLLEHGMIYHPLRYPAGVWDPRLLGVRVEDASFEASDGVRLHGWWLTSERAAAGSMNPVLLWCHGNAGNITGRAAHAQTLADLGLSVFLFDYRGYGRSDGRPSEQGLNRDAEAAYRYLVADRQVDPRRIILLGRSLGSAPASWLASKVEHAGLVLVSPFPSARAMVRWMFAGLPVDWLMRTRLDVSSNLQHRRRPLLVIHGERDAIVPLFMGRAVFEHALPHKEFLALPDAGHNDILVAGGDRYLAGLRGFASRCVEAACGSL